MGYRITVILDPKELKVGKIAESVTVKTDVKEAEEISFPLKGTFLGSITGIPYWPGEEKPAGMVWATDFLHTNLGRVEASKGGEGWYKLSIGDMPQGLEFEVTGIESSLDFVTATTEKLPTPPNSNRQFLLVTFQVKPGGPLGTFDQKKSAKITLKTNHPFAPEIKFYVAFQSVLITGGPSRAGLFVCGGEPAVELVGKCLAIFGREIRGAAVYCSLPRKSSIRFRAAKRWPTLSSVYNSPRGLSACPPWATTSAAKGMSAVITNTPGSTSSTMR